MNTNDLRKAGTAIFLAVDESVATDISNKLKWAADEIDRLRKGIEGDEEQKGERIK